MTRRDVPTGAFNVAKCAEYLRGIGVDVPAATEAGWRDAERTEKRLTRTVLYGQQGECADCARSWLQQGRKRGLSECPDCGSNSSATYRLLWYKTGDGVVHFTASVRDQEACIAEFKRLYNPALLGK